MSVAIKITERGWLDHQDPIELQDTAKEIHNHVAGRMGRGRQRQL